MLDSETVVVKPTRDGGYLCLGFGPPAMFLKKLDRDPSFTAADDASETVGEKFRGPFAQVEDPFLRRLGAAMAFAKDYDLKQPRDDDGRWTSGGAGAAAAVGSVATDVLARPELIPALRQLAVRLLSVAPVATAATAATAVGGAVLALGILVIPTNRSLISDGTVPGAPDLSYNFDQGTGVLRLTRSNEDGSKDILFSGHSAGGLFRDSDGNVIGRNLDGVVVVDPDAVAGYESRKKDKDRAAAGAGAQAIPIATTDEPKLCPDPGPDAPGWEERSPRSLLYQMQITGLDPGLAVELNGVSYDGCRETNGNMLEAKGPGFEQHMDGNGGWKLYFEFSNTGLLKLQKQIQDQSEAAGGRMVEWHVAEKPVADYIRGYAEGQRLSNIVVIFDPPRQP